MQPEVTNVRSGRAAKARKLLKRSFREAEGKFLAEGPQACQEAARHPGALHELYLTAQAADRHPDVVAAARESGAQIIAASGQVVTELAATVTPQGMVGVCQIPVAAAGEVLAAGPKLLACLVDVRDPGNLGTVIRIADAAGADAVLLTTGCVDPYNPKAVRATAGSIFHLPVVTGLRPAELADLLKAAHVVTLATSGSAELSVDQAEERGILAGRVAWIFGNEAHGLSETDLAAADYSVRVPIHGAAQSLNLAAAAAVCLYASARVHRRGEGSPSS